VNVDPRESGTATMTPAEFEGRLDRVQVGGGTAAGLEAQQIEARQSYWQSGLLLMLATLVAESLVGRT
jgi:hypothetical protein